MFMAEPKSQPVLETVKWQDVREVVQRVNSKLAQAIDAIKGNDKFELYKAIYPFGSVIIDGNRFYLPYNNSLVPLDDSRISTDLQVKLGYNSYNAGSVPLGITLSHSVELYMLQEDRIIPFSIMTQGKIFGLWGSLNRSISYAAPRVWHMTAGARCIFLLPKITDTPSYKKLAKARGIKHPMPRGLLDHGPILTQMAKHKDFATAWSTEMLFFPRDWLEKHGGEAWAKFHLFLYEEAWEGTEYWRNKVVYDYIWDTFVKDLARQNVKVMPYIVDIVEHLIMIGLGVLPGFTPAIDEQIGPIEAFKSDFVNIYGLKRFAPTIMIPKYISQIDGGFVYWSLQLPTYFESTPKPRKANSIASDLREIMMLLERFRKAVLEGKIAAVIGTPFYEFIKKVRFDFFHSDIEPEDGIRPSSEMPEEDKNLIKCSTKFGRRGFSDISPFARGCVRISLLET
jgi:hypothetical protein